MLVCFIDVVDQNFVNNVQTIIQLIKDSNQEKAHVILKIIYSILKNVEQNPNEPKFRKLKIENPKLKQMVLEPKGVLDLLKLAGFTIVSTLMSLQLTFQTEEFLVLPQDAPLKNVRVILENLENINIMKPAPQKEMSKEEQEKAEMMRKRREELKKKRKQERELREKARLQIKDAKERLKDRPPEKPSVTVVMYILMR